MKVGDQMECALLLNGKKTGAYIPVVIREISRHWQTGEPQSCRVAFRGKGGNRYIWVQVQMLRAIKARPETSAEQTRPVDPG